MTMTTRFISHLQPATVE